MAGNLTENYKQQLERWMGKAPVEFRLLYSITRDGCNSSTFHSKCDNQGATVTVLYNTNNSVYGGYTSQHWNSNSSGSWLSDAEAFLFQLALSGTDTYNKFPVKAGTEQYAIYDFSSHGPMFGGGFDLNTFNGSINKTSNYYPLNGSVNFGHTYDMKGVSASQINNSHMQVTDMEVYAVKPKPRPITRDSETQTSEIEDETVNEEWREAPDWSGELLERLTNEVESWAPLKELSIPTLNVLMIGPVGAGKSSFFNTVTSVFRGYVISQAASGSAEHSLTSKYQMYRIKGAASGRPLTIRLCDTRGLEEGQGIDSLEVNYLLDGHVPNGYQFNPSVPISPESTGFIKSPKPRQKIHCVCFVIDGSTIEVLPDKMLEKIKSLQARINLRGIPQLVLLTKVDKICGHVRKKLSNVFRSPKVAASVDKVSQVLGLPRGHILPVKNYENEIELDESVGILTVLTVRQILRSAQDYTYNLLEDMEELNTKE